MVPHESWLHDTLHFPLPRVLSGANMQTDACCGCMKTFLLWMQDAKKWSGNRHLREQARDLLSSLQALTAASSAAGNPATWQDLLKQHLTQSATSHEVVVPFHTGKHYSHI